MQMHFLNHTRIPPLVDRQKHVLLSVWKDVNIQVIKKRKEADSRKNTAENENELLPAFYFT